MARWPLILLPIRQFGDNPFRRYGFAVQPSRFFNTGVMVLRPELHREFLENVYRRYEDRGPGHLYEQVPFSYELAKTGQYEIIDPKYNVLYLKFLIGFRYPWMWNAIAAPSRAIVSGRAAFLAGLLTNMYFLHFAGVQSLTQDLAFLNLDSDPIQLKLDQLE